MDDDDDSIPSVQILTDCSIDDLAAKCKPLNVNLNRLDLSKNGIILARNDIASDSSSSPERETSPDIKKGEQESNSNDTAETIKKIKEFIALGRCEDAKKDAESSERLEYYKPGPLSKKKFLTLRPIKPKAKKVIFSNIKKLNMGLELERTLKGQDEDNVYLDAGTDDHIIKGDSAETSELTPVKENEVESKGLPVKNSDLVTPSRVSKRIQSKAVKFSAKKMLRGDDESVLKRMIPGYDKEIPSKKERSAIKTIKHEKVFPQKLSSPSDMEVEEDIIEQLQEAAPVTPVKEPLEKSSLSNDSRISTPEVSEPTSDPLLTEPPSSPIPTPSEQKVPSLTEKLGKFGTVNNGQITLELKGTPQKKVVRIAIPPSKPASPMPPTTLGPDIIIKRVKPVRKTVVVPENVKPSSKTVIEKEIEEHRPLPSNPPRILKMQPHVNIERIPTPKSKNELIKFHKNFLRRGRPPKKLDNLKENRADRLERKADEKPSSDAPPIDLGFDVGNPVGDIEDSTLSKRKEELKQDTPSLTQRIAEALEDTISVFKDDSPSAKEDNRNLLDRIKSKKIPKGISISHLKSKAESLSRTVTKPRKSELLEPSPVNSDVEEPAEPEPASLFDKYFKTEDRYIEHHDSLDSDSDDDFSNEIFSHFINLRRHQELKQTEKRDDVTMYDLMRDISVELPTWNIHVSSNGELFYLAQVDAMEEKPTLKKVIEIDLQYNAKVFVNGNSVSEYERNYSSYEDIKQLVYDVDQL